MNWIDVDQNSQQWLDLRVGRFGGSSIGHIMANYGKAFGPPAHKLALQIALERIKGTRNENTYSNEHMERGHEQEPIARMLYEREYFCNVMNGGYYTLGDDIGVSPDGRVSDNGLIEIKSVIASVHFDTVKRGKFDPSYKWQMLFEMMVAKKEWNDFISFCDEFPEGKKLFVDRLYAADCSEDFKMIDCRVEEFRSLIKDKLNTIRLIK